MTTHLRRRITWLLICLPITLGLALSGCSPGGDSDLVPDACSGCVESPDLTPALDGAPAPDSTVSPPATDTSPPPDMSPPPPSGCTSDKDCCPYGPTCAGKVEHCEIPEGAAAGACEDGCRSHDSCKQIGLDSCNGLYQCIEGGEHGDPCDEGFPKQDLDDCRFGYYCCPVMKECIEQCETPGEKCPDTGHTCVWWITGPKCFG